MSGKETATAAAAATAPPHRPWGAVAAAGVAAGVRFTRLPGSDAPRPPPPDNSVTVALHARLAGRLVEAAGGAGLRTDRASVLALDGLVADTERAELAAVLTGGEAAAAEGAPPLSLWSRSAADFPGGPVSWGLRADALARFADAASAPPAALALGARLAGLFPGCDVALLPAADMQEEEEEGGPEERGPAAACSAVMATAATPTDAFAWHVDADPSTLPDPTPWTAAYGRYANREPGRPWLVTAVVCLNEEWQPAWGGELRFLDSPTGVGGLILPCPGRVILMDQDCVHAVTPPSPAAPGPRYALVWKLAVMAARESRGGGRGQSHQTAQQSLGRSLAAAGLDVPRAADLGSAAALAGLVRRAGRGELDGGGGGGQVEEGEGGRRKQQRRE
jgi:hypothetical protein